ncbi:hypothetical protein [Kitasatospora indigofera]|uniref:hypothetical protein n=1 Tax=Kitasatospora indigofera TaxID=67307 RepID=UPI0033BDAC4F
MPELRLLHLTYAGAGKPTAQVVFDRHLTLIYGTSDTGKSFIVESIEYMLGGARLEMIPEAEGYSQILLGIALPDGTPVTLVRAPGSNTVWLHLADLRELVMRTPDARLTAVHTTRSTHSVAQFLLDQLGLVGAQVRTNDAGRTRMLNLRDLIHLALVTETRMVAPVPPALQSARPAGQTAAKSVMKFVLTGEGEPIVATGPNAGQRRVHKGKLTLLGELMLDLHAKLTTEDTPTELRARRTRIHTTIEEQSASLRTVTDSHVAAVAARTTLTQDTAVTQGRLGEIRDLLGRFDLLRRQYESDLARLDMVSEVGSLLGYFTTGTCVFCGAEPEHQHPDHGQQETVELHAAVESEAGKTQDLLSDLLVTMADLDVQVRTLTDQLTELHTQGSRLDRRIATEEEQLAPLRAQMDELLAARSVVERDLELHARIEELDDVRARLDAEGAAPTGRPADHIPSRTLAALDAILQQTLDTWSIPGIEHAEYDQYSGEVRAGGRARAGRGKGVRSVLHSAFSLALARYCIAGDLPHPGFLVLDSPVVTYREPVDDDVEITTHIVDRFYRDLLDFPGQAVIVENGDPPADIVAAAHCYQFTGHGKDRFGFFPARSRPSL